MTKRPPLRHVLVWPEHGVEMAFRRIPKGSFRMGSRGYYAREEPIHRVHISEDFWMAETPVTQEQFAMWTQAEGVDHRNHFDGQADHPTETMDWHQAVAYCVWLTRTKSSQFPNGFCAASLPSEAQWEYACRANTETEYHSGDGEAALAEVGWFGEDFESGSTHPVRQKKPNDFLLYDMHGNVLEWCLDAWDENAYRWRPDGVQDPPALEDDANRLRVLRGGSWGATADWCRSAYRSVRNREAVTGDSLGRKSQEVRPTSRPSREAAAGVPANRMRYDAPE